MTTFLRFFVVFLLIIIAVYWLMFADQVSGDQPTISDGAARRRVIETFVICHPGETPASQELAPGVTKWMCVNVE